MSDFNLTVLPILDDEHGSMVGVVTVDDLLEELLPRAGGASSVWRPPMNNRHAAVRSRGGI
jgi:CBS domain-containing protein